MRYRKLLFFQLIFCLLPLSAEKETGSITIGKRFEIQSEILSETRYYNLYLPPGYGTLAAARYPVVYLMDGDYNFHHTSGLVEQLSLISERIPEMIVVGIADNGHASYVKNCTPHHPESNPTGQSAEFLKFITNELQPEISANWPAASYDILIGHSLGGLFTINALLSQPDAFNAYIAISPSLWWNDYTTEKLVPPFFEKHDNIQRFLFLSLGNEKGMGVLGFQNQLDIQTFADQYYKNPPLGLNYTFKQYPAENHNSVGLITVKDALNTLFRDYDLPAITLDSLSSFSAYETLMAPYIRMFSSGFRFPERQLRTLINSFHQKAPAELAVMESRLKEKYPASLMDFYRHLGSRYVKSGNVEEGLAILKKNCEMHPTSPEALSSLGDTYLGIKVRTEARTAYMKALTLAEKQQSRGWYLNQLRANLQKVNIRE